jgi:hypothetical protein
MAKRAKKDKKKEEEAGLHDELKGFDIKLDSFGRIETNMNLDNLNSFLNRHLRDRKLEEKITKDEKEKKEPENTKKKKKKSK